MWKREFAGFEDNVRPVSSFSPPIPLLSDMRVSVSMYVCKNNQFARQQAHILRILRDLGMQGVPSLTKAKKLKEENEARQELGWSFFSLPRFTLTWS